MHTIVHDGQGRVQAMPGLAYLAAQGWGWGGFYDIFSFLQDPMHGAYLWFWDAGVLSLLQRTDFWRWFLGWVVSHNAKGTIMDLWMLEWARQIPMEALQRDVPRRFLELSFLSSSNCVALVWLSTVTDWGLSGRKHIGFGIDVCEKDTFHMYLS